MKEIKIEINKQTYRAVIQPVYTQFADVPGLFICLGYCPIVETVYEVVDSSHKTTKSYTVPDRNKLKLTGKRYKIIALGYDNSLSEAYKETHPGYPKERQVPKEVQSYFGTIITLPTNL